MLETKLDAVESKLDNQTADTAEILSVLQDIRLQVAEARAEIAEIHTDFDEALDRARELAGSGTVVVAGSIHTVGDALGALGVGLP